MNQIRYLLKRRKYLRGRLDVQAHFTDWEETCVPSYVHRNILAAYVSWLRLFRANDLALEFAAPGRVLDFGCGIAELRKLLPAGVEYCYVEEAPVAVKWIEREYPDAVRVRLKDTPSSKYDVIFALDSLEHNDQYRELIDRLCGLLADNGVLVISGPTENFIYRLGRKLAGFSGHYHHTNIHHIDQYVDRKMQLLKRMRLPWGLSLFVLSCWRRAS